MRIAALTQSLTTELRKLENSSRKAEKEQRAVPLRTADRAEFSADALHLSNTKSQSGILSLTIAAQPDVRMDKISEVKAKIDQGYYNSPEFTDKLAEKLLAESGINGQKMV